MMSSKSYDMRYLAWYWCAGSLVLAHSLVYVLSFIWLTGRLTSELHKPLDRSAWGMGTGPTCPPPGKGNCSAVPSARFYDICLFLFNRM